MAEMSLGERPDVSYCFLVQSSMWFLFILNREPRLPDHLSSSTRGEDADILLDEALGQVEESSLVVD